MDEINRDDVKMVKPRDSAGIRSNPQALLRKVRQSAILHHQYLTPNPHRLGVFVCGLRDTMRGLAAFRVCHAVVAGWPEVARFDSLLLSVLSKPAPTSSPERTQTGLPVNDLHVCRRDRLFIVLGRARHQARAAVAAAAQGIEYSPWRPCTTTRAR